MNLRLFLLTATAAVALVACPAPTIDTPTTPPPQPSPPAPPTPPTPQPNDTTAPTIVSVSPSNAENGVAANAKIRIEFSEAMNQAATEQAYQSGDMPSVTFLWNANGTKLEIDPAGDLEHTPAGRVYSFKVRNTATDLAGNALSELTSTFRTLRELKRTFESVAALDGNIRSDGNVDASNTTMLVGDSGNINTQHKSFVSFDLAALETDGLTVPQRITGAKMRVFQSLVINTPYSDLQVGDRQLLAAHVVYGSALNFSDFNSAILHDLGEISSSDAGGYKTAQDALESLRDDWAERVTRENRSQFMLFFPLPTDADGEADQIVLNTREAASNSPELEVTFLVP
jgi:Bacterial Ig-like domain